METMSAACCLIARVHRNRTITPADKVRAPDLEGCRRAFTSPVSAFECAFWDGTPGLCTRRPDRIPLDRARWVWQSPCGLIKIVTYTGTEFSHIVYNRASTPIGVLSPSSGPNKAPPARTARTTPLGHTQEVVPWQLVFWIFTFRKMVNFFHEYS